MGGLLSVNSKQMKYVNYHTTMQNQVCYLILNRAFAAFYLRYISFKTVINNLTELLESFPNGKQRIKSLHCRFVNYI